MAEKKQDSEKVETREPELLPNREAMSLISPVPPVGGFVDLESPLPQPPGDEAQSAATGATDAAASGSGEESVTDQDRHEQISQSDTASSST